MLQLNDGIAKSAHEKHKNICLLIDIKELHQLEDNTLKKLLQMSVIQIHQSLYFLNAGYITSATLNKKF